MKTITLDIEDDCVSEFLEDLKLFVKENSLSDSDITICDLTVEEYSDKWNKEGPPTP